MTQAAPARTKIPTETPQLLHSGLCERFAVPVIGAVTCQDITTGTCTRSSTPPRRRGRATGFRGRSGLWLPLERCGL